MWEKTISVRGPKTCLSRECGAENEITTKFLYFAVGDSFIAGYRPAEDRSIDKTCAANLRVIGVALERLEASKPATIRGIGETIAEYPVPEGGESSTWPECPLVHEAALELLPEKSGYTVIASGGQFLVCCPYHRTVADFRSGSELYKDPIAARLKAKANRQMPDIRMPGPFLMNILLWYSPGIALFLLRRWLGPDSLSSLTRFYRKAVRLVTIVILIVVIRNVALSTPRNPSPQYYGSVRPDQFTVPRLPA